MPIAGPREFALYALVLTQRYQMHPSILLLFYKKKSPPTLKIR